MSIQQLLQELFTTCESAEILDLKRGEILPNSASVDTRIFYILDGAIRIFIQNSDSEQNIRFGYQDNILAFLDSFLSGNPTQFRMEALRKTRMLILEKEVFLIQLKSNPEAEKLWTKMLEGLILQQMEREIDLLTETPISRYQRVLERSPQLFQEVPHKHIANYLRMTPETLSRLQKS